MKIDFEKAVKLLSAGEVVAIPTETVYGLAASVYHQGAIEQIYRLKSRPSNNPLILHCASWEQAKEYVELINDAQNLVHKLMDQPVTFILPAKNSVPLLGRANLPTVACRITAHPIASELLKRVGPCFAPSANLSGRPSSILPSHVEEDFGKDFPVLYGSEQEEYGIESTILHYNLEAGKWEVARLGAAVVEEIAEALGYAPRVPFEEHTLQSKQVICPGSFYRHYAPKAELILSEQPYDQEAPHVIGFSDRTYPGAQSVWTWGTSDDSQVMAQKLFTFLRRLDQEGITSAWIDVNYPKISFAAAVYERLLRAAKK